MMNSNTADFLSPEHMAYFISALEQTDKVRSDGRIDAYYGASLFLLTGLEYAWPRLRKYVSVDCIDHGAMLDEVCLSRGEVLIVRLAGNLYNGGFWQDSPWDLVAETDEECFALALEGLRLRKGRLFYEGGEVIVG